MQEFEWNPQKSKLNKEKHDINFSDATGIWHGDCINIDNIAHVGNEYRSATLGKVKGKIYVAIWTKRHGRIRLISVRRARKNEEKIYKKKFSNR